MGFTRLTTDVNYIQALDDLPNENGGMTAEQLKNEFDKAGNTNKTALNGLMAELEATTSAENLGAAPIVEGDTSDANIQAKLEKLYDDIQSVSQGAIPDASISEAKLTSELDALIGKKNGELQTNLNAEKLGGSTLLQVLNYINNGVVAGTYTGNASNSSTTQDIEVDFTPKMIFIRGYYSSADDKAIAIVIGDQGKIIKCGSGWDNIVYDFALTLTETGFRLTGKTLNTSEKEYNYVAIR